MGKMPKPCADCGGPKSRCSRGWTINNPGNRCNACWHAHLVSRHGADIASLPPRERRTATLKAAWARRRESGAFRTNAEKRIRDLATKYVHAAIRAGFLLPIKGQVCADCGEPAECYDHRDYSQPLLVVAVCLACNGARRHGLMPARIVDVTDH